MGTEIVIGGGSQTDNRGIERLFREREALFSPFIRESELSRVNESAGHLLVVSDVFAATLRVALDVAEETSGMVVPTVGAALEAAGLKSQSFGNRPPCSHVPNSWRSVFVLGRCVQIPVGERIDLNGVVKSLAVDDALTRLAGDGFVSAGGDIAARGPITVALPDHAVVSLRRGGLATSGNTKRRWTHEGKVHHHLIDPRTGRPATSPWSEVTACGATCLAADVAAKAGFLLGETGPGWLDARGIPARFITPRGRAIANESWEQQMSVTCI
jgi:thiamine biosynthesis lipoprotein